MELETPAQEKSLNNTSKKGELWKHQELAIRKAKDQKSFALLFEPGLGKTRTTLELLRHRYNSDRRINRTLIIAPLITLNNWRNEFSQYTKIPMGKIVVLDGNGKKREQMVGS